MDFGRFRKATRLGAGGFGEVWKAWDPQVGRWVALKFLKSDAPEQLARFRREAQTAAGLDHPNIAKVFEVGEADGNPYIAMEFVDGRPLSGRTIEPRRAAAMVRDAARGVQAAHERGIIHRDLKPANIMVDSSGRVLVMDFGLARSVESGSTMTKSGLMVGTPAYMSPEQARGEIHATDARSDVYGLGATLYEVLTGQPPFSGETVVTVVMKVVAEDAPAPRSLLPSVPSALEAIVQKCLEKEPGRRYRTAGELADDLDAFLAGHRVSARPEGRVARAMRRAARSPWILTLAAAFFVALAVGIVFLARLGAAEGRLTRAQQSLVAQMRTAARTSLDAALELRRAGNVKGMDERVKTCEEICNRVREEIPWLGEPWHLLASMRMAQMKPSEALELENEAIRRDDGLAAARSLRVRLVAMAMYDRQQELLREHWRREGERYAITGRAIAKPPSAEALVRGDSEWHRLKTTLTGDLKALESAELAADERECLKGAAAWSQGNFQEAAKHFSAALESETDVYDITGLLASIHMSEGMHTKAIDLLSRAVDRDRGHRRNRAQLGDAWYLDAKSCIVSGEDPTASLTKAAECYREASASSADEAVLHVKLAGLHAEQAGWLQQRGLDSRVDVELAVASYTRALEAGVKVESLRGRARVRANYAGWLADRADPTAMFEAAVSDYNEAEKLGGGTDVLVCRGITRGNWAGAVADRRGDPDALSTAAIEDFSKAISMDASLNLAWMGRGIARGGLALNRLRRGRDDGGAGAAALADLTQAVDLAPEDPQMAAMRGAIATQLAVLAMDRGELADGMLQRAVADIELALTAYPAAMEYRERRAQLYLLGIRWRQTRGEDWREVYRALCADVDEMLKRHPDAVPLRFHRGEAAVLAAGYEAIEGGDFSVPSAAALRDFEAGLAKEPKKVSGWMGYGIALQQAGHLAVMAGKDPVPDFRRAIDAFTKAIELSASHDDAVSYRGDLRRQVAQRIGDGRMLEEAKRDLEAACRMAPWRAIHHSRLGGLQMMLGRADAALSSAEAALKLDARCAPAWTLKGMLIGNSTDSGQEKADEIYRQAEACFENALKADPAETEAYKGRGGVRANRGLCAMIRNDDAAGEKLLRDAAADLERYVRLNPVDSEGWHIYGACFHNLATCLDRQGRLAVKEASKAVEAYERAVVLQPALDEALRRSIDHLSAYVKKRQ